MKKNKEKTWELYMMSCSVNDYIYIGGTGNLKERWWNHVSYSRIDENKKPLYVAMRELGIDKFKIIPLLVCKNKKEMIEIEIITTEYLKLLDYNLYNIKSGNKMEEDHKKIISKFHTGKILTEEHRKAISLAQTGKIITAEQREKISIENKTNPNVMAQIPKMIKVNQKPVIAIDKDGIETKFVSLESAAMALNMSSSGVSRVLKGRSPKMKGYVFKYDIKI